VYYVQEPRRVHESAEKFCPAAISDEGRSPEKVDELLAILTAERGPSKLPRVTDQILVGLSREYVELTDDRPSSLLAVAAHFDCILQSVDVRLVPPPIQAPAVATVWMRRLPAGLPLAICPVEEVRFVVACTRG
jgi:hypothetical protein